MANQTAALKNYHRETLERSIEISASGENIWKALLKEENFRIWASVFKTDSRVETNWKLGSEVRFTDTHGNGIIGKVMEHDPRQELSIRFERLLKNGQEDLESDKAKKWLGATENFYLNEGQSKSILTVEEEVPIERQAELASKWDLALRKVKEISESLEGTMEAKSA